MKQSTRAILKELIERRPSLKETYPDLEKATELLISSYRQGGKLLICGNGGSAADSYHLVGELMKSFCQPRPLTGEKQKAIQSIETDGAYLQNYLQDALPAIALPSESGLLSAYANDVAPDLVYAQEVVGYGKKGDVLLGISTSGKSKNIVYALETAKALGLGTIALTGKEGNACGRIADITIHSPEKATFQVQEDHLPIYHALALALENEFFGRKD
jgi:D-sedoheptulose 7-phosphate isomerase